LRVQCFFTFARPVAKHAGFILVLERTNQMIALALGLGVLGFFALRRARRRCYGGGYHAYGWHGPWAGVEDEDEHDHERHGHGRHGYGRHRGGPPWRGGRGRRWVLHRALSRIDATPAQERVIVGELDRLQERVHGVRSGLKETRTDLAAALRGTVLDEAALGAVLGRLDGATAEVRAAAIDAMRNVHAVLDDKQRATLAEMIDRSSGGGGGAGWWRMGPYR
jgi:hypothetical protein